MNIWNHVNEEILVRAQETNNPQNNYAVFIMRNLYVVSHVPLLLNKPF